MYPTELGPLTQDLMECSSRDDYGSGGMCDIYRGTFQERAVALKAPRVFNMVVQSRIDGLRKVRARSGIVEIS